MTIVSAIGMIFSITHSFPFENRRFICAGQVDTPIKAFADGSLCVISSDTIFVYA